MRKGYLWLWGGTSLLVGSFLIVVDTPIVRGTSPSIVLGTVAVIINQQVTIDATLQSAGVPFVGIQNDIGFDPQYVQVATTSTGAPNCIVNTAIAKSGHFSFLPVGCSGSHCAAIRAVITATHDSGSENCTPIGDAVLYSCQLLAGGTTGTYTIANMMVAGSDAFGDKLTIAGVDGQIIITSGGC